MFPIRAKMEPVEKEHLSWRNQVRSIKGKRGGDLFFTAAKASQLSALTFNKLK